MVGQTVLTVDDGGQAAEAPTKKGKAAGKAEARATAPAAAAEARKPKAQPAGAPEDGGLSQEDAEPAVPTTTGAGRAEAERDRGRVEAPQAQQPDEALKPRRGEVVDIGRGSGRAAGSGQPASGDEADAGPAAPAAPSVRRLARELGVDIRRVSGSGPDGRITAEDVQGFVRAAMARGAGPAAAAPLPDFSKWGEVERRPTSNLRRKTAAHPSNAGTSSPPTPRPASCRMARAASAGSPSWRCWQPSRW